MTPPPNDPRQAQRTPLIAGNWKLHKTVVEAEEFIAALLPRVSSADGVEVAICPTFTALGAMLDSTRGSRAAVYARILRDEVRLDCPAPRRSIERIAVAPVHSGEHAWREGPEVFAVLDLLIDDVAHLLPPRVGEQ